MSANQNRIDGSGAGFHTKRVRAEYLKASRLFAVCYADIPAPGESLFLGRSGLGKGGRIRY